MIKVSVLGCGWLGLPLAEFLLEKDFYVKGSTTSAEKLLVLEEKGIEPFLLDFQPEVPEPYRQELREFLQSDILVINIPPRLATQGNDFHIRQITHLLHQLPQTTPNVIYVSSTSVYPDANQTATEVSAVIAGNALVEAEKIVQNAVPESTILRCGGLMGYNRIPGKYVAGKTINTGQVPVNFVHRDDVIRIIYEIIRQEKWGQTYNVVAPQHPIRREVYAQNVRDFGFEPPVYDDSPIPAHKVINGDKLMRELHYTFLFPDPVTFSFQP